MGSVDITPKPEDIIHYLHDKGIIDLGDYSSWKQAYDKKIKEMNEGK